MVADPHVAEQPVELVGVVLVAHRDQRHLGSGGVGHPLLGFRPEALVPLGGVDPGEPHLDLAEPVSTSIESPSNTATTRAVSPRGAVPYPSSPGIVEPPSVEPAGVGAPLPSAGVPGVVGASGQHDHTEQQAGAGGEPRVHARTVPGCSGVPSCRRRRHRGCGCSWWRTNGTWPRRWPPGCAVRATPSTWWATARRPSPSSRSASTTWCASTSTCPTSTGSRCAGSSEPGRRRVTRSRGC